MIARYGAVRDSYDHTMSRSIMGIRYLPLHCKKKGVHCVHMETNYGVQYTLTCPYMHTSSVPYTLLFLQCIGRPWIICSQNSCTANAVCAAYQLDLKKQAEADSDYTDFDPSRSLLQHPCSQTPSPKDAGASLRDTIKALNTWGVCEESDWPYDTRKFRKPTRQCYSDAEGNDLRHYKRLNHTDIHQLRACLKEKKTICIWV